MPQLISVMACRYAEALQHLLADAVAGDACPWPGAAALEAALARGVAFVVAYRDGEAVGLLAYRQAGGSVAVEHVHVRPGARRQGVATRMLQAVEVLASAMGSPRLTAPRSPGFDLTRRGYAETSEASFEKPLSR